MGVISRYRESRESRARDAALAERFPKVAANLQLVEERLAELELELEDEGWIRLGLEGEHDFSEDGRRRAVNLAHLMWLKNPLMRRGVNVAAFYVFGQGVEVTSRDPEANEIVRAWWDDHANRAAFTSQQALELAERDQRLNGERFIALFTDTGTGRTVVRSLPPHEITRIVRAPGDRDEIHYYVRKYRAKGDDGVFETERELWYRDWRFDLLLEAGADETLPPGKDLATDDAGEPVLVYSVLTGRTGRMMRGHPEVYPALSWARAYKAYLEDWASIARSLAIFAWKATTKGKTSRIRDRIASRLSSDSPVDANPKPATGSAAVLPMGDDLTPIRTSGAQASADDGIQLRKMVAAGLEVPDNILSNDPQQGALATAKTLDRPTELAMRSRQQLWASVISDLATAAIANAVSAGELPGTVVNTDGNVTVELGAAEGGGERDATVDVMFPPILEADVKETLDAIAIADGLGGTLPARTKARLALSALGVDDVDELIELMYPDGDPELAGGAEEEPDDPEVEAARRAYVEAVAAFREAIG